MKTSWLKKIVPRFISIAVLLLAITLPIIIGIAQVHADAVDLYWFGGTGNWSNATDHWSETPAYITGTASFVNADATVEGTGGLDWSPYDGYRIKVASTTTWYTIDSITDADTLELTGAFAEGDTGAIAYVIAKPHIAPLATNNVFFGATSFTGAGQIVTVDVASACLSMDWTGATNTPSFVVTSDVSISGGATFISAMSVSGAGYLAFIGTGTLTTNGLILAAYVKITTVAGTITLGDNFTSTTNFIPFQGIFTTANHNVTAKAVTEAGSAAAKVINLGSSVVTTGRWNLILGGAVVNAGTSTIIVNQTDSGVFAGNSQIYNNVELTATAHTVSGTNTFAKLSFKPAAGQTITFTDTTTQTASSFERTGTGQITFQGSAAAGWALTDNNGGTNTFNALTVSRSTASGATFNATTSSLNSGNNVGWTFPTTITTSAMTSVDAVDATGNATVTDQGGSAISERGFVYNTTGTPTTADNKVVVAGTLGSYSGTIPNGGDIIHYVRPYFTNATSTYYGTEVSYSIPAMVGGYLLKNLLRVLVAAVIMVGVIRMSSKGGVSLMLLATVGILAFAIISTLIDLAL